MFCIPCSFTYCDLSLLFYFDNYWIILMWRDFANILLKVLCSAIWKMSLFACFAFASIMLPGLPLLLHILWLIFILNIVLLMLFLQLSKAALVHYALNIMTCFLFVLVTVEEIRLMSFIRTCWNCGVIISRLYRSWIWVKWMANLTTNPVK